MTERKEENKEVALLFGDDIESEVASGTPFCRICHEIEFESCKTLEAPCSCSGTVKVSFYFLPSISISIYIHVTM